MQSEELFALVFVTVVFAGVGIVLMGLRQRSQQLEMLHKERMAMIERGVIPGPDGPGTQSRAAFRPGPTSRSMSLGIIIVAVGLGLMTIISIAGGAPESGVGIGGAIAIVGAAFIVNSLVGRGHVQATQPQSPTLQAPPRPPDHIE